MSFLAAVAVLSIFVNMIHTLPFEWGQYVVVLKGNAYQCKCPNILKQDQHMCTAADFGQPPCSRLMKYCACNDQPHLKKRALCDGSESKDDMFIDLVAAENPLLEWRGKSHKEFMEHALVIWEKYADETIASENPLRLSESLIKVMRGQSTELSNMDENELILAYSNLLQEHNVGLSFKVAMEFNVRLAKNVGEDSKFVESFLKPDDKGHLGTFAWSPTTIDAFKRLYGIEHDIIRWPTDTNIMDIVNAREGVFALISDHLEARRPVSHSLSTNQTKGSFALIV
jgi:hypothetical protein